MPAAVMSWFKNSISNEDLVSLLLKQPLTADEKATVARAGEDLTLRDGRIGKRQRDLLFAMAKRHGLFGGVRRTAPSKPFRMEEWIDAKPDVRAGAAAYDAMAASRIPVPPPLRRP